MATLLNPTTAFFSLDPNSEEQIVPSPLPTRFSGPLNKHTGTLKGSGLLSFPTKAPQPKQVVPSFVHGVSLTSVLQMLHLERMTCVLEVTSDTQFGTLTLVNGELVDAEVEGADGEQAAYVILNWRQPHTTILDGVTLFRNTVKSSLSTLIVEAVRRQDEDDRDIAEGRTPTGSLIKPPTSEERREAAKLSDLLWLVETLIISGASAAAVINAADERVLAQAHEKGDVSVEPAVGPHHEFAPVLRAASHWARQSFPVIDEITMRLGEKHALVSPLDGERSTYVCATFDQSDGMDLARSAIRTISRS